MLRTNKFRRSPATTDDISNLRKYGKHANVIEVIAAVKKQWSVLEECNAFICQNTTDFILQNKPIFDAQKITLIKINNLIDKLTKNGLVKFYKHQHLSFNDYLSTTTYSDEWNDGANKINILLHDIVEEYNREHIIVNMFSTIKPKKKTTEQSCLSKLCTVLLIVCCIAAVICLCYVFSQTFYNQLTAS